MIPAAVDTSLGTVHYVRAGQGPTLVLLHGNGHSWREFEPAIGELTSRFDVIAWDMPGHGASGDCAPDTPIEGYAAALGDFVLALALERPAICGSSVGAFIAAAHAAADGAARGLILAEMQFRARDWWVERWPMVERMFGDAAQSREAVQSRFMREVDAGLLTRWNEDRARTGSANLLGVMAAIRDFDIAGALTRAETPCRFLFGEKGPAIDSAPEIAEVLGGRFAMIRVMGAGHFISLDQPAGFAGAVTAFLHTMPEVRAP